MRTRSNTVPWKTVLLTIFGFLATMFFLKALTNKLLGNSQIKSSVALNPENIPMETTICNIGNFTNSYKEMCFKFLKLGIEYEKEHKNNHEGCTSIFEDFDLDDNPCTPYSGTNQSENCFSNMPRGVGTAHALEWAICKIKENVELSAFAFAAIQMSIEFPVVLTFCLLLLYKDRVSYNLQRAGTWARSKIMNSTEEETKALALQS